jgi:hypothetical protein
VIQVVEIDSGEPVPFEIEPSPGLLHENVALGRARWTPDGRALVYIGQDDDGRIGVFAQDFAPGRDTSDTRRPVAGFSRDFLTESLGISPDGSSIVISALFESRSLKLAEGVSLSGWN